MMIKQHKSISGTAGSCCNFTDKTESHPYQIPEITYSCSLFPSPFSCFGALCHLPSISACISKLSHFRVSGA